MRDWSKVKWFTLKLPWYIRWRPSVRRWVKDTEDRIMRQLDDRPPPNRPHAPKPGMYPSWGELVMGLGIILLGSLVFYGMIGAVAWLVVILLESF